VNKKKELQTEINKDGSKRVENRKMLHEREFIHNWSGDSGYERRKRCDIGQNEGK
jgi:hypothetical protein